VRVREAPCTIPCTLLHNRLMRDRETAPNTGSAAATISTALSNATRSAISTGAVAVAVIAAVAATVATAATTTVHTLLLLLLLPRTAAAVAAAGAAAFAAAAAAAAAAPAAAAALAAAATSRCPAASCARKLHLPKTSNFNLTKSITFFFFLHHVLFFL